MRAAGGSYPKHVGQKASEAGSHPTYEMSRSFVHSSPERPGGNGPDSGLLGLPWALWPYLSVAGRGMFTPSFQTSQAWQVA